MKVIRHSAIYSAGILLSRLTGFVMIPLYTRYLGPAEYGTLDVLSRTG